MNKIFLTAVFVLLLFSTMADGGSVFQISGVLIFLFIGALSASYMQSSEVNVSYVLLTHPIVFLLLCMPVQSIIVIIFYPPQGLDQADLLVQSFLAFAVVLSSVFIVSRIGWRSIQSSIYLASIISIAFVLFFEIDSLIDSLSFVSTERGRVRFSPFGNHPNLTGHIFGGYFLFHFAWAMDKYIFSIWRVFSGFLAIICFIFVLATSSRGSFLATIFGSCFLLYFFLKNNENSQSAKKIKFFLMGGGCIFIMWFLLVGGGIDWVREALELDSEVRGFGSGGTGRVDNWADIIYMSLDGVRETIFGSGIRSWNDAFYGFATDSSFINMIWESGWVTPVMFWMAVVYYFFYCLLLFHKNKIFVIDAALISFIGFVFFESIFARYMIAIGNPMSIIFILVLIMISKGCSEVNVRHI